MFKLFLLTLILKLSSSQRRITNGTTVDYSANTHFMVSIVSAEPEEKTGWLCGGSIIHPSLILSAASCLHEFKKLYVIAGHRKYVRTEDLETNACTRHMKKRIVYYCLHSEYGELEVNKGDKHTSEERKYKWTMFDIGIARTDTPIDFFDHDYVKFCSYLPSAIQVNFHQKFQEPGLDAVVYGWGHADHYRPREDKHDYNVEILHYASSKIMSSEECQNKFTSNYIKSHINVNYICTDGRGNLNAHGRNVVHAKPRQSRCGSRRSDGNYTKAGANINSHCMNDTNSVETNLNMSTSIIENTRRNGICQNDHGSPLVRWIGGHPFVIGVASAFQVNQDMECVGPYLFSSTQCSSKFVYCVLVKQDTVQALRVPLYCEAPDTERGFKIEETYVDWTDEVNNPKSSADYGLYDSEERNNSKI